MLNDGVNLVSYEDNRATLITVKPMNQISNRVLMVQIEREKSLIGAIYCFDNSRTISI